MPPDVAEMNGAGARLRTRGLPYLVRAKRRHAASATPMPVPIGRARAYRFTVEDSVYVAPDAAGRGIGRGAAAAS